MAAQEHPDVHVIVIDNRSSEDDRAQLAAHFGARSRDRWTLLQSDRNTGYAGSNLGIRHAVARGATHVLLMNNDTTAPADLIARLLAAAAAAGRPGLFAPAIDEGHGTSYGGFVRWCRPELPHNYEPSRADIQFVTGACVLVDCRVFHRIGLLDERFFLYFEDADYCLRARKVGLVVRVVPDVVVRHEVSATTRQLGAAVLSYYHYRNAHLFAMKHAPAHVKALLPVWSAYALLRVLSKWRTVPAAPGILRGVLDFYRGRFGRSPLQTSGHV